MAKKTQARPKPPRKQKVDTAWFETRMSEMGYDRAAAAKRWNTYPNMIWRVLTGARPVRTQEIIEWCEWLQVPITVGLFRFGFDVPRSRVPVIGNVNSDGRISILPPGHQEHVDAPGDMQCTMVALRVKGDNRALSIYDGALLYYEPSEVVSVASFGRLSVVELGDHLPPLVGIVDRASGGRGRITLFGGAETIESDKVVSATPIRWQKL